MIKVDKTGKHPFHFFFFFLTELENFSRRIKGTLETILIQLIHRKKKLYFKTFITIICHNIQFKKVQELRLIKFKMRSFWGGFNWNLGQSCQLSNNWPLEFDQKTTRVWVFLEHDGSHHRYQCSKLNHCWNTDYLATCLWSTIYICCAISINDRCTSILTINWSPCHALNEEEPAYTTPDWSGNDWHMWNRIIVDNWHMWIVWQQSGILGDWELLRCLSFRFPL